MEAVKLGVTEHDILIIIENGAENISSFLFNADEIIVGK